MSVIMQWLMKFNPDKYKLMHGEKTTLTELSQQWHNNLAITTQEKHLGITMNISSTQHW